MASSLLVLLDDIATLLDDVAAMTKVAARQSVAAADDVTAMTKVAAQKTAGVLGDDLALNAQQVTGVNADRELPVVWAVFKGSMINKAILVPAALVISGIAPWAITPLLMLGGLFLCFEGAEKVLHTILHSKEEDKSRHDELVKAVEDEKVDLVAFEKDKVKGAIRTDFILSAEIIVITLGTVTGAPLMQRMAVLAAVAVVMTMGVYGLVGAIVKIDDVGLYLNRNGKTAVVRGLGRGLLALAPKLMKALSVLGTLAMFLVGGGILLHGIPPLGHAIEHWAEGMGAVSGVVNSLVGGVAGFLAGATLVGVMQSVKRLRGTAQH